MKKSLKKGFTLVELVIVIAVIAILSAVLVPTFGDVISDANKSVEFNDASQAINQYKAKQATNKQSDALVDGYVVLFNKDYLFASATAATTNPTIGVISDLATELQKVDSIKAIFKFKNGKLTQLDDVKTVTYEENKGCKIEDNFITTSGIKDFKVTLNDDGKTLKGSTWTTDGTVVLDGYVDLVSAGNEYKGNLMGSIVLLKADV